MSMHKIWEWGANKMIENENSTKQPNVEKVKIKDIKEEQANEIVDNIMAKILEIK